MKLREEWQQEEEARAAARDSGDALNKANTCVEDHVGALSNAPQPSRGERS